MIGTHLDSGHDRCQSPFVLVEQSVLHLGTEGGAEPGQGVGVSRSGQNVQQIVSSMIGQIPHQGWLHAGHNPLLWKQKVKVDHFWASRASGRDSPV
jgi:hypothetical protein